MSAKLGDSLRTPVATSLPNPRIVVRNEHLQSLQRRFALATIVVPFLSTIVAISLIPIWGFSWVDISLLIVMFSLGQIGSTVGFHRYFAHHAFKANRVLQVIMAVLGSISVQGPLIHWVSYHRRHHQYSDMAGDPHSPYVDENGEHLGAVHGFWHSHLGWMMHSRITNSTIYAKDILRDPLLFRINRLYLVWVVLGMAFPALLGGLLLGSVIGAIKGFLWGGMVRLFLSHHAFWTIGSIAHIFGSHPFDTHDRSTNNVIPTIFNFGESWHNNHHAFPNSPFFGLEWWQIDIGGWVIRLLALLGWIWDLKIPTRGMMDAKRLRSAE